MSIPIRFGHKIFHVSPERARLYLTLQLNHKDDLARLVNAKMELLKQWGMWFPEHKIVVFPGNRNDKQDPKKRPGPDETGNAR